MQAYSESLAVARTERDYKAMAQSHNEIVSYMRKASVHEAQVRDQHPWLHLRKSGLLLCVHHATLLSCRANLPSTS